MVTRFIDALDASNAVIATYTETNDSIMSWDIPTIFPTLTVGTTYNFVMRTPETAGYTVPSTAWTPAALGGFLDGWFDADDATTFTMNSSTIAEWRDKSSFARHISQSNAARQPTLTAGGLNGKPVVTFDGGDGLFTTTPGALFSDAPGASIFAVVNYTSAAAQRNFVTVINGSVGGGSRMGLSLLATGNLDTGARRLDADARVAAGPIAYINATTIIHAGIADFGAGPMQQWRNGTKAATDGTFSATGNSATSHSTLLLVGGNSNDSGATILTPMLGFAAEIIMVRGQVTTIGRQLIEGYLAWKWGLQASLPAGHPFLSAAPQGEGHGTPVTPFLTQVDALRAINGAADNGPSMGINFSSIEDWEDPIFIDRAKQARGWERPGGGATPAINLDSEGALASLPGGDTTQNYFFSSFRDGGGVHVGTQPDRGGRFRATITGGASAMTGFGISNITQINATTWEFDCDWIGNKWLTFTPTAFPIKVSIVRTDLVSVHAGGAIFDPDWLADLPSGGCVRFMDWQRTNNSTVVSLADYPVEASQRWRRAPLSVMVALCNAKGLDPWICIPQAADDTLITNWATYLRDNLNTARKIRVEYSNEIWNTGLFSVGLYLKGQAETVWGVPDGYGGGGFWLDYGGKKFAQVMAIFNSVFTGQTSRLIGVIAGQAANSAFSTRILNASAWQTYEPGAYVAPHTRAKEFAIADYVGWLDGAAGIAQGNRIKAALDISHAAAVQAVKNEFPAGLALTKNYIATSVALAATRNLRLVSYEYGNHFDLNAPAIAGSSLWSSGSPVPGALNAFVEATYSQEMADVMDDLRDFFKAQAGSLKCQYVYMARGGIFGTWGARTHRGHNSAIWNAIVAWHAANPRWWTQ